MAVRRHRFLHHHPRAASFAKLLRFATEAARKDLCELMFSAALLPGGAQGAAFPAAACS